MQLLGDPVIEVDGRPLQVDTRKAIALLAVLAVEGRRSREQLAALLWPESDETRARGALRRTLSALGSGLGPGWLHADRQAVALDDGAVVDVRRADELEAATSSHSHDRSCATCRTALDELVPLHRGPFLDGFALRDAAEFDAWRSDEVERRRRQLCQALDRRTALEVADRDLEGALRTLRTWREAEPLNEQVHRRLIQLHGQRGERLEAVNVYRECVAVLERELGVAPLDVTTRLYQSILDGASTSPPPAPTAPAGVARVARVAQSTRTSQSSRPAQSARPVRPARAAGHRTRELPLVGRDLDLEHVREHLRRPGAVVLVQGEAGIGKTRFVEELEAGLHRDGTDVLAGRCHRGEEGLAFGAVVELLRDLLRRPDAPGRLQGLPTWQQAAAARLLPELPADVATVPIESSGSSESGEARLRFLEAVAATVEGIAGEADRPVVLLLEDIHLADTGTRDLLAYLARRLDQRRLRLVVTRRTDDGNRADTTWQDPALRERLLPVTLGRLDRDDVRTLCTHALGAGVEVDGVVARLQQEAEGLPLALVQYLEWLAQEDVDVEAPWPLPNGLREVLEERLAELDETTAQVTAAVAVIGHGVDLPLLVEVSGRSEDETVAALDELLDRAVVVASRDGTFELAHDRMRAVAYEACSPARRRLLHARVAAALSTRAGRRGGGRLAARIAEHARSAGLHHEAARWSLRAGDHALSVFANTDALEHFETALALEPDAPAAIHARIARVHVLAGDYPAALAAYEAAAALAADEAELTLVEHELGALHVRRREWAAARLHLETALAGSHTTDPGRTARIRADVGLAALQRGDFQEADEQARAALTAAESVEDREALAQARNLAGMVARRRGAFTEAQRHLEHAAALAAHLRDPSAYIAALNNLALTTAEAGEPDRAEQLLVMALDRCERQGDRHRQAALLNNLADLHHRRGDNTSAQDHLVRAVALFSEVGGTVGDQPTRDPEVWKLVEW